MRGRIGPSSSSPENAGAAAGVDQQRLLAVLGKPRRRGKIAVALDQPLAHARQRRGRIEGIDLLPFEAEGFAGLCLCCGNQLAAAGQAIPHDERLTAEGKLQALVKLTAPEHFGDPRRHRRKSRRWRDGAATHLAHTFSIT